MHYMTVSLGIVLLFTVFDQTNANKVCFQSKTCVHNNKEKCGVNKQGKARRFLDSCDMLEYNCLKKTDFEKTSLENCDSLPPIDSPANGDDENHKQKVIHKPAIDPHVTSEETIINDDEGLSDHHDQENDNNEPNDQDGSIVDQQNDENDNNDDDGEGRNEENDDKELGEENGNQDHESNGEVLEENGGLSDRQDDGNDNEELNDENASSNRKDEGDDEAELNDDNDPDANNDHENSQELKEDGGLSDHQEQENDNEDVSNNNQNYRKAKRS